MSHLPRLHPEDLAELANMITRSLKEDLRALLSKEQSLSQSATYTIQEASLILNKNSQTVARYCRSGYIKAVKSGKEWVITQKAIDEYLTPK